MKRHFPEDVTWHRGRPALCLEKQQGGHLWNRLCTRGPGAWPGCEEYTPTTMQAGGHHPASKGATGSAEDRDLGEGETIWER